MTKRQLPYYHMPHPENSLAGRLKQELAARGWTQVELSRRSGVAQNRISGYVRGENRYPRPETLEKMNDAFGLERGTLYAVAYGEGAVAGVEPPAPGSIVIPPGNPDLHDTIDAVLLLADEPDNLKRVRKVISMILAGGSNTPSS